jgi:hypothetical protein
MNSAFQIFPFFVPGIFTGFMSYVQIISIHLAQILQPLQFSLFVLIQ